MRGRNPSHHVISGILRATNYYTPPTLTISDCVYMWFLQFNITKKCRGGYSLPRTLRRDRQIKLIKAHNYRKYDQDESDSPVHCQQKYILSCFPSLSNSTKFGSSVEDKARYISLALVCLTLTLVLLEVSNEEVVTEFSSRTRYEGCLIQRFVACLGERIGHLRRKVPKNLAQCCDTRQSICHETASLADREITPI